ncbi:HupE/UreJ family protein [Sulfurivermis fontis]|uniref:HupE/UreJ family protein n=1 Tax=Sulfurivermis fontis TaxID=1972068 RepID=UPI000FD7095B|nr:HupE/UreJ family protein [Sulfurivermis fontis]
MKLRHIVSIIGLMALPGIAAAHTGLGTGGFGAGLLHPFSGVDHLLAMLTVGLWAATLGGSAAWKVPMAFIVMLVTGAVLGLSGTHWPLVESFIAASVLVLGLAVTLAWRVPAGAGIALVGLFALFHGHAHGAEVPVAAVGYLYVAGMVLASGALHLTGFGIGHALRQRPRLLRGGGALVAGAGAWLVAGLLLPG